LFDAPILFANTLPSYNLPNSHASGVKMRGSVFLLVTFVVVFPVSAQEAPLPAGLKNAQSLFNKAVDKAKAEHDLKIEMAGKELEKVIQEAKKAYLKQLDDSLLAETKKGNLDGANAIKAERDRVSGGDGKANPRDIKIALKIDNEKSIRSAFEPEGNWRIEKGAIHLFTGAALTGVHDLTGDFLLTMSAAISVETGQFYRVTLSACGESFVITESGATTIRLERKGEKLSMRLGALPPRQLTLKEANKDKEFRIRIHCVPNGNFAGKSEILIRSLNLTARTVAPK
jgi:hypothetical protein